MDDLSDHQTVPEYNTRAVEKLTGIPADTFRAWERRHGLPAPARTSGNHRLYSERDIAILQWLKKMTDDGLSISRAVSIARRRFQEPPARATPAPSTPAPVAPEIPGFVALRDRLIAAFTAFDASEANHVMEEALALYASETVAVDIIQPALIELGSQWERGEICVAMEHFGTSFCMRKLSAMFNAAQPELGEPTVLVSCVEGELHEIGLMINALVLARAGYRVIYLGANMPGSELVEAVNRTAPDAIVLSAPSRTAIDTLRATVQTLQGTVAGDSGILIGYGGAIFEQSPELRDTVNAVYLGKDARTARDILRRALRSHLEGLALTTK